MDSSFLLVSSLFLALSTPCSACRCKLRHPQTYYCISDIVIIADILGPGNDTALKRSFRVSTTKILKAPRGVTEIHNIYTPKEWDDCGFELRTSTQLQVLIAGYLRAGKMNFTRCHLIYFWNNLTQEQKIGFEKIYKRGCKCHVQPCFLCRIGCPEPDFNHCVWKQRHCEYDEWEGNHSSHSTCVPSASGRCDWTNIKIDDANSM
ncbi:metalloproteinase inhibitor 1-like [Molossus nigricans]